MAAPQKMEREKIMRKYVLDVVISTDKPKLKKDIKAAVEKALASLYPKVRVRTVDED